MYWSTLSFILCISGSVVINNALLPKKMFSRTTHKIARNQAFSLYSTTLGSDALVRPEDEDSPEFKEYLKQLLTMQASRARAGHAAPSSSSADAYIAKLNRIKLERLARRNAGLPEDDIDTSYLPEDYEAAM
jgi:hypothetical protein